MNIISIDRCVIFANDREVNQCNLLILASRLLLFFLSQEVAASEVSDLKIHPDVFLMGKTRLQIH